MEGLAHTKPVFDMKNGQVQCSAHRTVLCLHSGFICSLSRPFCWQCSTVNERQTLTDEQIYLLIVTDNE